MFTVGIIFSIALLSGYIKLPKIFATTSWTQTDWSGGVGASTNSQFDSSSNVDYTTSGEVTLTGISSWYNSSWKFRKKITFDNRTSTLGTTSEALVNFPVLVKLNSSSIDYINTQYMLN
jgi:hypothetical protein